MILFPGKMNSRRFRACWLTIFAVAVAAGCSDPQREEATGKGTVRGINAIADAPELVFLIEERNIDVVAFKAGTGVESYDDLSYTFNFDALPNGNFAGGRLASQFIDFAADTEYTLVLTGTADNASIMLWEEPERDFEDSETVVEVDFVHLSSTLGEVDVYFVESGTAPALGNEVARLSDGDRIPYAEYPFADYEFIVTAPGDPGTILFQSFDISPTIPGRLTLALFDVDPTITASVAVGLIAGNGTSTPLPDVNSLPQLRLFHASQGTDAVDGYFADDLANRLYFNVGFGQVSPYVDIPTAGTNVTLTAVDDPTTTFIEDVVVVAPNARGTVILTGDSANLAYSFSLNNGRSVSSFPILRITNLGLSESAVDIYIVDPGTPIDDDVFPFFSFLSPPFDTSFFALDSGQRELVLTTAGQKTVIADPVTVDASNGNVFDLVILDTATAGQLELRQVDGPSP